MGCGETCVKYILFFANFFFALAGLALLVLGVLSHLAIHDAMDQVDALYRAGPITTMVIGSIVFLIAFFGCCGAIRESNCMLITYSIFMLLLMVLKIALTTAIFVSKDALINEVATQFNQSFQRNGTAFQEIELSLGCCGPNGPSSYNNSPLPSSCCPAGVQTCTDAVANPGCISIVSSLINTFGLTIGLVLIVVISLELVAVVFGLCLANHVRNKYRRSRY